MLLIAGHPQYVYFTLVVFSVLTFLGWFDLKSLPKLLAAAAFAGLLALPQILPAFQAYQNSGRQMASRSFSASYYWPIGAWPTAFDPFFWGFEKFRFTPKSHGTNAWEASLFFGGVGAVFLALRGLTGRYALALAATLMLALGEQTPVYDVLYRYLPAFKSFRGTCKFSVFFILLASVSVARGFDNLWNSSRSFWAMDFAIKMMKQIKAPTKRRAAQIAACLKHSITEIIP
jgi:hypothetical protein